MLETELSPNIKSKHSYNKINFNDLQAYLETYTELSEIKIKNNYTEYSSIITFREILSLILGLLLLKNLYIICIKVPKITIIIICEKYNADTKIILESISIIWLGDIVFIHQHVIKFVRTKLFRCTIIVIMPILISVEKVYYFFNFNVLSASVCYYFYSYL